MNTRCYRKITLIILWLFASLHLVGCGSSSKSPPPTYNVSGHFQKGPFSVGSQVVISELHEQLQPTGKVFNVQTKDDLGSFELGSPIGTHLVEIVGDGFFVDELTGQLASSRIQLRAVVDLSKNLSPTINVLTSLQAARLKKLMTDGNAYSVAESKSRDEVLRAFGMDPRKLESNAPLYSMKIEGHSDADSVLLAISCVLLKMAKNAATANSTSEVAELSNFINTIGSQIANSGAISDPAITTAWTSAAMQIDASAVRSNVESYYANRGLTITAPKFEEWIDADGSGILPRRLVQTADLSISDVSGVEAEHRITSNIITVSGIGPSIVVPLTVDKSTTIIKNGAPINGTATTVKDGDSIALCTTSPGYGLTNTSTITIGTTSKHWHVTTKPLGGTIRMLVGTGLVLQNNGGEKINLPAGTTSFSFSTPAASGSNYDVQVVSQPTSPSQVCTVGNGTGTVGPNPADIVVSCAGPVSNLAFTDVSGVNPNQAITSNAVTIGGLGAGIVAAVTVSSNTTITKNGSDLSDKTTTVQDGDTIALRVSSLGFGQTSTSTIVIGPSSASWNVATRPFGGTISNLSGTGLVLQINSGEQINVPAGSTTFNFQSPIGIGGSYDVKVVSNPTSPLQACTIANGTGTVGSDTSNTSVVCSEAEVAYTAVSSSNYLSAFLINTSTGELSNIGKYTVGSTPHSVGIIPGKFVYAANMGSNSISLLKINSNGSLTSAGVFPTGLEPSFIAIHPSGNFAYVLCYGAKNITTYSIDPVTGALSSVASIGTGKGMPTEIRIHPSGKFAYLSDQSLNTVTIFKIDQSNGTLSTAGVFSPGVPTCGIAIDSSGSFAYIVSNTFSSLVLATRIDAVTGALSTIGSYSPIGKSSTTAVVAPNGKYLYVNSAVNGAPSISNLSVFSIDVTTGELSSAMSFAEGTYPWTINVDPTGHFLYATTMDGHISGYRIDQNNGGVTEVGILEAGPWADGVYITKAP